MRKLRLMRKLVRVMIDRLPSGKHVPHYTVLQCMGYFTVPTLKQPRSLLGVSHTVYRHPRQT